MSLLDKQEVQDIPQEHTALCARKWSGCKRASEDTTYHARSTEERRRRKKKTAKLRFFTSRVAYVKLRYIAMLYTHLIGNQP